MPLIAPQIHDNGTPAERLKDALSDSYDAIQTARSTLRMACPNPRDYGPETFDHAIAQHLSRCRRLSEVMDELEAEMDAIDAQVNR